jgi:integrase
MITTDIQAARAKTARPQEYFTVSGAAGLALSVTRDGTKTWSLRYTRQFDGKRRRLTLGGYPALSMSDARDRANKALREVADGHDPAAAKTERRAVGSFGDLADEWLTAKVRQGRAKNYTDRQRQRIKRLPKEFREMSAASVKRADVSAVLREVEERGVTSEVNATLRLISAVLKWAVQEGRLAGPDPIAGMKKTFDEQVRDRVFTDDEVNTFYSGIATVPATEAAKIAMRLVFVLGQRPKEICELRRADLLLSGPDPTAKILKTSSKNKTDHVVPLPKLAVELIKAAMKYSPDSEWLFPTPLRKKADGTVPEELKPLDSHALSKAINRAREKKTGKKKGDGSTAKVFGMANAELYDAKTTIATWLGDNDYPDEMIGVLFNHKSASKRGATKHYNHSKYMKLKRTLIELWARHLDVVLGRAEPVASNVVELASVGKSA